MKSLVHAVLVWGTEKSDEQGYAIWKVALRQIILQALILGLTLILANKFMNDLGEKVSADSVVQR